MLDTLENVKERLGIETDQYDDFLTDQITLISDVIEAYCRRKFNSADYIQTFYRGDAPPSKQLELFHFPVTAIEYIEEDGEELDDEGYRLHKPTGFVKNKYGAFFYSEETVVKFTAGYVDIPTPILSVLDSIVQERYNKKTAGIDLNFGSDIQRLSIPGVMSIDFDYTLDNNNKNSTFGVILGSQTNVLDSYRSERAILGSGTLEYVEED